MSFSRLTSLFGLWLVIAATALLTACGGGSSGSPSRPPFQLTLIHAGVAFSGDTYEIRITGGRAPYTFQSSNPLIISDSNINSQGDGRLNIIPGTVSSEVPVSLIITDRNGTPGTAMITVRPSYLYPGTIWVTPLPGAPEECSSAGTSVGVETEGYASICVGAEGIVQVVLKTSDGFSAAGRLIRFDWEQGSYYFPESQEPGQRSITVTTDGSGKASATIRAQSNVKTHVARIRATEVSSGQNASHSFMIATQSLSVFPTDVNYTVPYCSSQNAIFSIYGGIPPYQIVTGSHLSATPDIVPESGGSTVVTSADGWCLTSTGEGNIQIRDATGNTIHATFTIERQEVQEPEVPATPEFTAAAPWANGTVVCSTTDSYSFVATGGTAPYRFSITSSDPAAVTVPAINTFASFSGTGSFRFTAVPTSPGASVTVRVFDSLLAEKTFTLTCQ